MVSFGSCPETISSLLTPLCCKLASVNLSIHLSNGEATFFPPFADGVNLTLRMNELVAWRGFHNCWHNWCWTTIGARYNRVSFCLCESLCVSCFCLNRKAKLRVKKANGNYWLCYSSRREGWRRSMQTTCYCSSLRSGWCGKNRWLGYMYLGLNWRIGLTGTGSYWQRLQESFHSFAFTLTRNID